MHTPQAFHTRRSRSLRLTKGWTVTLYALSLALLGRASERRRLRGMAKASPIIRKRTKPTRPPYSRGGYMLECSA